MTDRIQDNKTLKEIEEQIRGVTELQQVSKILGYEFWDTEEFENVQEMYNDLIVLPDKFNDIFSDKGWIAHESMNPEIMKKAIKLSESSYAEAENCLVSYYETFLSQRLHINMFPMYGRERYDFIHLAINDYFQGRYYSTILVILTQIDGIINDIKNTGLFADNTKLEVWDSISGHSSGLKKLVTLLKKGRKKTTNECIEFPYRNGILHGRDLNFNDRLLAAKSLALLIYVVDWYSSAKDEQKRKDSFEKEKKRTITLPEVFQKYEDHKKKMAENKSLLDKWQPRLSEEINYENPYIDTPEYAAVNFFNYLKKEKYGKMVKFYPREFYPNIDVNKTAGQLRKEFSSICLLNFQLINVHDKGPAISNVELQVRYYLEKAEKKVNLTLIMLYEVGEKVQNRLISNGEWRIRNTGGISNELKNS